MSWDVLLLPLPEELTSIDDLPVDHVPLPVGSRSKVLELLRSAVPDIDLTDPAWGQLLRPTWVIEFNIGTGDPVESVMLHVRGGEDDVLPVIFRVSRVMGCRPFDCSAGELLREDDPRSWQALQAYRDGVIAPNARGTH